MSALDIFGKVTSDWFTNSVGSPTQVQDLGWPKIKSGAHTLIVSPTGTGKTLCAFLVFIDELKTLAGEGRLDDCLQVLYISPLKALSNDIRENLKRPLNGIAGPVVTAAVRTGDTDTAERNHINKKPPHILITTPESLYLMLTAKTSRKALKTARVVIIDEMHALINTKRGAHLMLSLERLDDLCGMRLQRVGLSATITPLDTAAKYLAGGNGNGVETVAPKAQKLTDIKVISPTAGDMRFLPDGSIWPEIAKRVYDECQNARSVIAFTEGRLQAEKLSYMVNELGGGGFSLTHHGCVSKEQRLAAEKALKSGSLRLLCATSSMELGIDVGEIDLVLQIGNPHAITSAAQRLGRAGHNPGLVSVMQILPKTVHESVYCGITAKLTKNGDIEMAKPPEKCLDVLAQHLTSMAAAGTYTEDGALKIICGAYNFKSVTRRELRAIFCMLAGDYEHNRDIPARPRIIYDRVNKTVTGDAYSRMIACMAAGTIPDRGYYSVKLEDGTRLGELDEEFVFEARVGDRFLLGSSAWKILNIGRDLVTVARCGSEGATPPFWRGDAMGRCFETGVKIGKEFSVLNAAYFDGRLRDALASLSLDEVLIPQAAEFISRQIERTGVLPDDKTIVVERFIGETGDNIAVHSIFGRKVNVGLSLLAQDLAQRETGANISVFDDDDGFLLMVYANSARLPEGLLQRLDASKAAETINRVLPATPLFTMAFRYNAGRALMMGLRNGRRQPLWVQRLKSAEVLDNAIDYAGHPILEETRRECLNDYLDISSIENILRSIKNGVIQIHEIETDAPSSMSLPLRRQAEMVNVYDYYPMSARVKNAVNISSDMPPDAFKPSKAGIGSAAPVIKKPENADSLHALMMARGDVFLSEAGVPREWFEMLIKNGRAFEIGKEQFICAEHKGQYDAAFFKNDLGERANVIRRLLRYSRPLTIDDISVRYPVNKKVIRNILENLISKNKAIYSDGFYCHASNYERAVRQAINSRRAEVKTYDGACYAKLLCRDIRPFSSPEDALKNAVRKHIGLRYELRYWENIMLPRRVRNYRPALLDDYLKSGDVFWQVDGAFLTFYLYEDIDWEAETDMPPGLSADEIKITDALKKRGACFVNSFSGLGLEASPMDTLLSLAAKGLAHTDSFAPVRQILTDTDKTPVKRRVKAKVTATAGRWDLVRKTKALSKDETLEREFSRAVILCKETVRNISWQEAYAALKTLEYTGRARRGYFIKGMSGAQFVKAEDYTDIILALESPLSDIIWLNARDQCQIWNKLIKNEERFFICAKETAVALKNGEIVAVFSKNAAALNVFDYSCLESALAAFIKTFNEKQVFPRLSRVKLKQYAARDEEHLRGAGFIKQMTDYVLWRKVF